MVCASGNLGLISFNVEATRLSLESIEGHYPGLIEGLARHLGIGALLVRSEASGPVVIGREGLHLLDDDRVVGRDPLEIYGPLAAESLRRMDGMADVADIVAISLYDPDTDEVAAFEELIGSHGGLGGAQTRPLLLYPASWTPVDGQLIGAPAVHAQLRRWMEHDLRASDGERPPDADGTLAADATRAGDGATPEATRSGGDAAAPEARRTGDDATAPEATRAGDDPAPPAPG